MMRAKWWRKPLFRRLAAAWQRASGWRTFQDGDSTMTIPAKACFGALLALSALSALPATAQAQAITSGPLTVSGGGSVVSDYRCSRSEEHTSELQSLMRTSYDRF